MVLIQFLNFNLVFNSVFSSVLCTLVVRSLTSTHKNLQIQAMWSRGNLLLERVVEDALRAAGALELRVEVAAVRHL